MSKGKGKRGFVRPQVQAQIMPPVQQVPQAVAESRWAEAEAGYLKADAELEAAPYDDATDDLPLDLRQARWDARDKLFSTPAPNGRALAVKIATLGELHHSHWNPRRPGWAKRVMEEGTPDSQALLACYFDAMSLSGLSAKDADDSMSEELSALVARFYRTLAAYRAADHESPGPDFAQIEDAQMASYEALLAYEPRNLSELAAKAHLIWADRWNEKRELEVFTADALRLVGAIFGQQALAARLEQLQPRAFNAAAWLAEYRALGGDFALVTHNGASMVANRFPDEPSARATQMRMEFVADDAKARAIEAELQREANGGAK